LVIYFVSRYVGQFYGLQVKIIHWGLAVGLTVFVALGNTILLMG